MASVFKIRFENKNYNLVSTQNSTVEELMAEIRDVIGVMPSRQQILFGYPPQPIPTDSSSLQLPLQSLGIQKRELFTLIKKDLSIQSNPQSNNQGIGAPITRKSRLEEAIKVPIPSDNSCLFNSISYLCIGSSNRGIELRNLCIQEIKNHPTVYTEAMLGSDPKEYCRWISQPDHWGGYIEMNILSKHFQVEICVVYIEEVKIVPVNACNSNKKIYILYDGIHYDSIVFRAFGAQGELKIVDGNDSYADFLVLQMARTIEAAGGYTNTTKMSFQCDTCKKVFTGNAEAQQHSKATGHYRFTQSNI